MLPKYWVRLDEFQSRTILNELTWFDRSPLAIQLKKYQGKGLWVHFTDVEKIGVNPKIVNDIFTGEKRRTHSDAPGIYFYPVDWLIDHTNGRIDNDSILHGMKRAHFFICDITEQGNLYLPGMTVADIEEIASRNGFIDELSHDWREVAAQNTGYWFWYTIKAYVMAGKMTWGQALRGFKSIFDDRAIIHPHEEEQLLVRDRSVMRIVAFEKNQDENQNPYTVEYWKQVVVPIFQGVAKRYKGKMTWKHKMPMVSFFAGDVSLQLWMNEYSALYLSDGLETKRIDDVDLSELDMAEIEAALDEEIAAMVELHSQQG